MIVRRNRYRKRIWWGAVFGGVAIALVVQLLLSMLGLGIGFGSINPLTESNPFEGLGTGALVWWVLSMLIALFFGGLAAGRLSGIRAGFDRVMHGILTFSIYSLFSFYLLTTTVGGIISGVGSLAGQIISMAGKGVGAVAPKVGELAQKEMDRQGLSLENIKREAGQMLRDTGNPELQSESLKQRSNRVTDTLRSSAGNTAQHPQIIGKNTGSLFERLFAEGNDVINNADRDAAINVVMKRTGKSRQESEQIVDNWIYTYHQGQQKLDTLKQKAEQEARETGDAIASAASKASIFAFIGLVLGAAAAAGGAGAGRPQDTEVVELTEDDDRGKYNP